MSRFTIKDIYPISNDYSLVIDKPLCQKQANNKLGHLEDLEEQLGCSLEVVFKALKQGYIYSNDIFDENGVLNDVELVYDNMESENYEFFLRGRDRIYDGEKYNYTYSWRNLKDYKKTWWLKKDRSE